MESYSINYSLESLEDLRKIYIYIAKELNAPETAKKQIDRIKNAIRSLDTFPQKFKLVEWEPWHSIGMHQLCVDNFIVFYLIGTNCVNVVRIFYGKRNIPNIIISSR